VTRLTLCAALLACSSRVITVVEDPAVDAAPPDAAPPDAPAARYAWGDALDACHRALGRVTLADGRRCAGVLLAPTLALTTAGCVLERADGAYLPASALTFTPHGARAPLPVARVVHGRDEDDPRAGGDWAALVLAAPAAGVERFPVVAPPEDRVRGVAAVGYTSAAADELAASAPCDLRRFDDDSVAHTCGFDPAVSGGVVLGCERGAPTVHALTAQRADPRERARYNAAPLGFFREAPLAPTSVAAGPATALGPVVYAFDETTRRVHLRTRDGERWAPWRALPVELPAGSRVAAAGLQRVAMPYLAVLGGDGVIRHLWSDWSDVGALAHLDASMAPPPGGARLVEVAVTGSADDRIELFAVDATGMVYVADQEGAGVGAWSPWFELGRLSGARYMAAATFFSPYGPSRTIVVSTPGGVHMDWSGTGYGPAFWEPRSAAFPLFVDAPQAEPSRVAVGAVASGQLDVLRVTPEGEIRHRARIVVEAWAPEVALPQQVEGGAGALAAGRLRDGRMLLVATTRGPGAGAAAGELVAATEDDTPGGGFARARWRRFYR